MNPDPVILREQWKYATRQYSRWYSQSWGTTILAGLSFSLLDGLPVMRLASNSEWIQAGVVYHPVPLTEDYMKEVKVPLAIFASVVDEFFPVEELQRLAHVLAQKPEWTPSERRLITGSQSGELTLWNGQSFNFQIILLMIKQLGLCYGVTMIIGWS